MKEDTSTVNIVYDTNQISDSLPMQVYPPIESTIEVEMQMKDFITDMTAG